MVWVFSHNIINANAPLILHRAPPDTDLKAGSTADAFIKNTPREPGLQHYQAHRGHESFY